MKIQFVIPTHARPHRQTTFESLPPFLRERTIIVTSTKEDAKVIAQHHSPQDIKVASGTNCIAQKRHWIMKNIKGDVIFMMDDDMTFFTRCPSTNRVYDTKAGGWVIKDGQFLYYSKERDFRDMVKELERAADTVHGIGLSSRMGNNRVEERWLSPARMMHAFGIRADMYKHLRLRFDEIQHREDFNITLRLLTNGCKVSVYYDTCVSPGSYGAAGGASTERTMEGSNDDAERLASMYPGLVRVVEKDYKSSIPRKEVVVQWKKAMSLGLAPQGESDVHTRRNTRKRMHA